MTYIATVRETAEGKWLPVVVKAPGEVYLENACTTFAEPSLALAYAEKMANQKKTRKEVEK